MFITLVYRSVRGVAHKYFSYVLKLMYIVLVSCTMFYAENGVHKTNYLCAGIHRIIQIHYGYIGRTSRKCSFVL